MSVGKFLVGWLGITTLCALGAHYVYPGRDGLAAKLLAKAETVKSEQFADWASISFKPDGKLRNRIAYISGTAPSEDSKTTLRNGILSNYANIAVGSGGVKDVVFVNSAVQPVGPTDYSFRAEIQGGDVVLTGVVPSEEARTELLQDAKTKFAKLNVIDKMTVKAGNARPGWTDIAKRGMGYVATLGNQYTELSGTVLAVVGKSADPALVAKIENEVANGLPPEYQGRPTIEGPGLPPAQIVPETVKAEVDTCQADLDNAMNGKTIEFDTGKATIRQIPNALLDNIAAVAQKCPAAKVEVAGHTDSRGSDVTNQALSQARAEAVVAYLVSKGVAADRLTSKGMGETAPLDPAETPEAFQKNRRIEFNVSAAAAK
jgi:OmpA-OmpF porin, OOP family